MVSLIRVASGFISVLSKIHPVWLKQGVFSLIFSAYFQLNRLKSVLVQMNLSVFIVSGVEKNSGEQIRILY